MIANSVEQSSSQCWIVVSDAASAIHDEGVAHFLNSNGHTLSAYDSLPEFHFPYSLSDIEVDREIEEEDMEIDVGTTISSEQLRDQRIIDDNLGNMWKNGYFQSLEKSH